MLLVFRRSKSGGATQICGQEAGFMNQRRCFLQRYEGPKPCRRPLSPFSPRTGFLTYARRRDEGGFRFSVAKKSLLLVDADSKSLRMLEVSLRKCGFSVTTAIHVADAHDKLKHAAPDLIITDTRFPGGEDGFEFVARLKSKPETAAVPVIFLSSENKLAQKVAGLELGVEDYLTKPIYIKEVLTRVRVLLDKREKQSLELKERTSAFSGLLDDMGLVDLIQTVEIGRKTGRLNIETRGQRGQVSFKEGKVINARSGRLTGERAFYRMLVWNVGTFSMEFGTCDEPDVMELSTQGLLMEGVRRVDEWGQLSEQLPPLDHVFEIDFAQLVDRLAEVPDEANLLLRFFDGRRSLLGVVDAIDIGDLEALEIASNLYFEGLIFDVTDVRPVRLPEPAKDDHWLAEPAGIRDEGDHEHGMLLVPDESLLPTAADGSSSVPPELAGPLEQDPSSHAPVDSSPGLGVGNTGLLGEISSVLAPPSGAGASEPLLRSPVLRRLLSTPALVLAGPSVPDPRPLPLLSLDDGEPRAVVQRADVGAVVWSSDQKSSAARVAGATGDDVWDDIRAPDEPTPFGGLIPVVTAIAPPPSLAPSLAASALSGSAPAATAEGLAPSPSVVSVTADRSISLTLSPTPFLPFLPFQPITPAAGPLATDGAGTASDDDSLERALSDQDDAGTETGAAAGTDVGQDLASSITAQLEPVNLPPELTAPPRVSDFVDKDPLAETDKGRRHRPPSPTPTTQTPSKTPEPIEPDNVESIHNRSTQLDIEAELVIDRFGVSKPLAIAAFAFGFSAVVVIVLATNSSETAGAIVDAGMHMEASAVDAGAEAGADAGADSGGTLTVMVSGLDAGLPPPGLVDAGSQEQQGVVVDAGSAVAVAVPVAVPVPVGTPVLPVAAASVDVGSKLAAPPPDPLAEYSGHLKAAEAASKRGEFARSVRSYKAALAVQKESVAAHLGIGNAYYELDNLDAALVHLERARALAPKDPQIFVLLGAVYQSSGRKSDAVSAYERYLDLMPDGKFARDVKGILRGLKN